MLVNGLLALPCLPCLACLPAIPRASPRAYQVSGREGDRSQSPPSATTLATTLATPATTLATPATTLCHPHNFNSKVWNFHDLGAKSHPLYRAVLRRPFLEPLQRLAFSNRYFRQDRPFLHFLSILTENLYCNLYCILQVFSAVQLSISTQVGYGYR
jgi:hypothetical protein